MSKHTVIAIYCYGGSHVVSELYISGVASSDAITVGIQTLSCGLFAENKGCHQEAPDQNLEHDGYGPEGGTAPWQWRVGASGPTYHPIKTLISERQARAALQLSFPGFLPPRRRKWRPVTGRHAKQCAGTFHQVQARADPVPA